jgi:hypothetical protein
MQNVLRMPLYLTAPRSAYYRRPELPHDWYWPLANLQFKTGRQFDDWNYLTPDMIPAAGVN